jgi:hypothetical protein
MPPGTPAAAAGLGGNSNPTAAHWYGTPAVGAAPAVPATPNIIPNPSVIPILAAADANVRTAAKIELTYIRPGNMNFTPNDARLQWSATAVAGGAAVQFVGAAQGTRVFVYGTTAGEIRLDVKFHGALLGSYRAVVRAIKQLPCRFNILNGPSAASQPRATPQDVLNHVGVANCFLRQIGLELVRDTNHSRTNGATLVRDGTGNIIDGIFRIRVAAGWTRNVSIAGGDRACRLNYRRAPAGQLPVLNFAYIHSDSAGNLGAGSYFPDSKIAVPPGSPPGTRPTITDNGTPSSSWIRPGTPPGSTAGCGVPPDTAAGNVTMTLIARRRPTNHARMFGMFVTDGNGNPASAAAHLTYAGTIAHELGHMLNLGHRVEGPAAPPAVGLVAGGIFFDGLVYPPTENVMHFNAGSNLAQDFDILQAKAVWQSPLVNP